MFGWRNQLRQFLLNELRQADGGQVTSREMAGKIIVIDGQDPLDKKLLCHMVKRVGKGFQSLCKHGVVIGERDQLGLMRWSLSRAK